MGSPDDEQERLDFEGPQHVVHLTQGYWLADTACTQEFWEAIVEQNPSHFQGASLPVEEVSFNDIESALERLNRLVPNLSASLPSEAQWEYACRAGTMTPYSFGQTITTDQANLENTTTVPVKAKPANAWGLYQMHGNVWEWCHDWFGEYSSAEQFDPLGPAKGSDRVVRGGSWFFLARGGRAAYRYGNAPGYSDSSLGFRLLSSAGSQGAEPTESAQVPVAEQGPKHTRVGGAVGSVIRIALD